MKGTNKFLMVAFTLGSIAILSSCSLTRRTTDETRDNKEPSSKGVEYIKDYKDLAIREMKRTGIPASITLAQGMLESDYGNSTLARNAKNHFGIKCHNLWKGPRVYHDDDRKAECFRKYNDVYESYEDHSKFLTQTSRYEFLFDYKPTQYKAWAKGLKKAGYATSRTYSKKLIELIERYKLYRFDSPEGRDVASSEETFSRSSENLGNVDDFEISHPGHTVRMKNRIDYIIVKKGDTFDSLNEELEMLPWELRKYNDLEEDSELEPGQVLYLQPKRNKAAVGNNYHIVKEGDTMHSISQLYGIKLEKLYKKNNMEEGDEIEPGKKLWLRSQKPESNRD
ncbi:MAG: glucosaminidase domain-containing protein [Bacteroidota bacterium]